MLHLEMSKEESKNKIEVVQLDGLVLMKIIKHCTENAQDPVTGQLLGLDVDGRLEVTDAFPLPYSSSESTEEENAAYQIEMMKTLRLLNVDANMAGWYQSALSGDYFTQILQGQHDNQKTLENSVVVVYDPTRSLSGKLAVKAYRLSDSFMKLLNEDDHSHTKFSRFNLESTDLFEEIPIKVHNSHLVHGFLYELREEKSMSVDFDRLELSSSSLLERNFESLGLGIEDYIAEQQKFQFWQRQVARQKQSQQQFQQKREEENVSKKNAGLPEIQDDLSKNTLFKPLPAPSRLETFLFQHQMDHICAELTSLSTSGINKSHLAEAIKHKVAEK